VVKRIHPQLVDPEFVGMFINEARISALLAHPNIVQIYDFGSVAERYFIAMEWVPGKTAKDLLKKVSRSRRTVPPELVMLIAHQVCKATRLRALGPDRTPRGTRSRSSTATSRSRTSS
jgi:serine/threonine-protein kinase